MVGSTTFFAFVSYTSLKYQLFVHIYQHWSNTEGQSGMIKCTRSIKAILGEWLDADAILSECITLSVIVTGSMYLLTMTNLIFPILHSFKPIPVFHYQPCDISGLFNSFQLHF